MNTTYRNGLNPTYRGKDAAGRFALRPEPDQGPGRLAAIPRHSIRQD